MPLTLQQIEQRLRQQGDVLRLYATQTLTGTAEEIAATTQAALSAVYKQIREVADELAAIIPGGVLAGLGGTGGGEDPPPPPTTQFVLTLINNSGLSDGTPRPYASFGGDDTDGDGPYEDPPLYYWAIPEGNAFLSCIVNEGGSPEYYCSSDTFTVPASALGGVMQATLTINPDMTYEFTGDAVGSGELSS